MWAGNQAGTVDSIWQVEDVDTTQLSGLLLSPVLFSSKVKGADSSLPHGLLPKLDPAPTDSVWHIVTSRNQRNGHSCLRRHPQDEMCCGRPERCRAGWRPGADGGHLTHGGALEDRNRWSGAPIRAQDQSLPAWPLPAETAKLLPAFFQFSDSQPHCKPLPSPTPTLKLPILFQRCFKTWKHELFA